MLTILIYEIWNRLDKSTYYSSWSLFFFTIRSVVGEINEINFDWYFDPDNWARYESFSFPWYICISTSKMRVLIWWEKESPNIESKFG